jgi:hypothetical protein
MYNSLNGKASADGRNTGIGKILPDNKSGSSRLPGNNFFPFFLLAG